MTRPDEGAARPTSRRALREEERRSGRRIAVPSVPVPRFGKVETRAEVLPGFEAKSPADARAPRQRVKKAVRPLMSMGAMLGVTAMLLSTSFSGLTRTDEPAEAAQATVADV